MKILHRENLDTEGYTQVILQFRNTPDLSTKTSPAEIVFGRVLRDVLPIRPLMQIHDHDSVKPEWRSPWKHREDTLKSRSIKQIDTLSERCHQTEQLLIGDTRRVQNQTKRNPRLWDKLGTVVEST